jgi:phospholipase/lecithinase/hemolysin
MSAPVPQIPSQIDLFAALSGGSAPSDGQYVIWAGANDLIFAPDFSPAATASEVVPSAVNNIQTAIEGLEYMGARDFLVLNLPDLGVTPFGVLTGRAGELSEATDAFNNALADMIAGTSWSPGLDIEIVDVHTLFSDLFAAILEDPVAAGFPDASAIGFPPALAFCFDQTSLTLLCDLNAVDPNDRVFWDLLHPTSRTHGLIADAVLAATTVPEPATLALIALGLAGLEFERRKRKQQ